MRAVDLIKPFVPLKVRKVLAGMRGRPPAHQHQSQQLETNPKSWERSRIRWRAVQPNAGLTWGVQVDGADFIRKAAAYGAFGSDKRLLEIGPGYGRLLTSITEQALPFRSYLGVDLSKSNIEYLTETFSDERIDFVHGDIEEIKLSSRVDSVFSSLTFKHLFPTFEAALATVSPQLKEDGIVVFDLFEGVGTQFEYDDVTYIRQYTRPEVSEILDRVGLETVAFDEVHHDAEHSRLMVIAGKKIRHAV